MFPSRRMAQHFLNSTAWLATHVLVPMLLASDEFVNFDSFTNSGLPEYAGGLMISQATGSTKVFHTFCVYDTRSQIDTQDCTSCLKHLFVPQRASMADASSNLTAPQSGCVHDRFFHTSISS